MKMKFIKDIQANLSQSIDLPVGRFAGLFIESSNLTRPTGAFNTLTSGFDLILDGKTKQSYAIPDLKEITDILAGKPTYTIATASPDDTITLAVLVPFAMPMFPNAVHLSRIDEGTILYRAGNCTGGSLSIYGYIDKASEEYVLNEAKMQNTGSGRVLINIALKNVVGLFIKPSNVADKIQITVDGDLALDCFGTELLRSTEILHKIEATTLTTGFVNLAPTGALSEALNTNVRIEFQQASSGTPTVWAYSLEFIRERKAQEQARKIIEVRQVQEKISKTPLQESVSAIQTVA